MPFIDPLSAFALYVEGELASVSTAHTRPAKEETSAMAPRFLASL
jgi:hypothetical protein